MSSPAFAATNSGILNVKWKTGLVIVAVFLIIYLAYPVGQPRHSTEGKSQDHLGFFDRVTKYLPEKAWKFGDHDSIPTVGAVAFPWPWKDWLTNNTQLQGVWPGSKADIEEHVAICIAVRDQYEDLKEWLIHHYYHLGIRRFYIMDDGSSPALDSYEDYPIPRSAITFRYYTRELRESYQQRRIYNDCNAKFGNRHNWIGYIDADEYLEMVESPGMSLAEFLRQYESYGALGVQWIVHNSNGAMQRVNSTRQAYTSCISDGPAPDGAEPDNRHIKSLVQTKYYHGMESPHNFFLNSSMFTVGEQGDRVTYAFRVPITRKRIALHHYAVKSRAEFEEKMQRGNAASDPKGWGFWDKVEGYEKINCSTLADYNP